MFCSNCGQKIDYRERFCSKCGAPTEKTLPAKKGLSSMAIKLIFMGIIVMIAAVILVVVFLVRDVPSEPAIVDESSKKVGEPTLEEELVEETAVEEPGVEGDKKESSSLEENNETEVTGVVDEEFMDLEQEQQEPWEYIIGDYKGVQVREQDSAVFLKRINIVDNRKNIRIDCYSQDKGVLEDEPKGIVYIPKDDIEIVDNEINIDFKYMVDYRPGENKIGYFNMYLTLDLDNPDVLQGVNYYNVDFLDGKFREYTFSLELEKK